MTLLIVAVAVLLLALSVWASGLYRVVRGDPLDVDWQIDQVTPALQLRLQMAGRAGPLVLTGLRVEGEAADLVDASGPDGMEAIESDTDAAWVGRLPVGGRPVRLVLPLRCLRPARGRLVIYYTYASGLARMSSGAWVPIEIPADA